MFSETSRGTAVGKTKGDLEVKSRDVLEKKHVHSGPPGSVWRMCSKLVISWLPDRCTQLSVLSPRFTQVNLPTFFLAGLQTGSDLQQMAPYSFNHAT